MNEKTIPEYQPGDDLANLAAVKREMFHRAVNGNGYSYEVAALSANAFANLIRAELALRSAKSGKLDLG